MKSAFKNIAVSLLSLILASALSAACQWLDVEEHISTIFVFAVFIISILTDGYLYGFISAVIGMLTINYLFTYPFFAFDFIQPFNLISAIIMVTVAILTSMLTTKIKQYEETMAEGERERMRANLLRAVSHDLRTPLTSIYSASSVLRNGKDVLTEEQKNAMLQNIQEDSEWLVRMVENLLSITRIDNETMKIVKTPVSLDELIDSILTKFSIRCPGQAVSVTVPDEIVVVSVDAILIEQVIINLLENAVFHAEGMTALSLRVFTLADQVIFEIADNGCGIDESRLKTLFSGCYEVQQDRSSQTKRYAGIGLSVCATIVKAHGGTITAENRKGGGALFRFNLKKEEAAHDEQ